MSTRRAHADIVVPRSDLAVPGRKAAIRQQLIRKLESIGRVETIERFVQDPPDGPFRDGTFGEFDLESQTLIRVVGYVTPAKNVTPAKKPD